jgi:hypothetical protein
VGKETTTMSIRNEKKMASRVEKCWKAQKKNGGII